LLSQRWIKEIMLKKVFEQVHIVVRCIPTGKVASYGQIARMLGQPHGARTVGWAMRGLPEGSGVPWHRVLNAAGRVSISDPGGAARQRRLLEIEGVIFEPDGRIDLNRFGWEGMPWPEVQALLEQAEG
jgi:methylated-DNA-protein-cysteine methyltransferase-like protein